MMSKVLFRLTLPVPPSVNGLYVPVNGRLVLSAAGRDWKRAAAWQARDEWGVGHDPLEGGIGMQLIFYRARKRGDLTNLVKATEDALKGIVYVDDEQVIESYQCRMQAVTHRIEVAIWEAYSANFVIR